VFVVVVVVVVVVVYCLKKRTKCETVQLNILWIDYDEIWLRRSIDSRIEFACFSFHVCLLFYQPFVFQNGQKIIKNDNEKINHNENHIVSMRFKIDRINKTQSK